MIKLSLKSKIWFTVLSVVVMFAFFVLFYFPEHQQRTLLHNYNTEVQNLANTVALGVKIALTEQNLEGVETAMDFVRKNEELKFVGLMQVDSTSGLKSIFKTLPYPNWRKFNLQLYKELIILKPLVNLFRQAQMDRRKP